MGKNAPMNLLRYCNGTFAIQGASPEEDSPQNATILSATVVVYHERVGVYGIFGEKREKRSVYDVYDHVDDFVFRLAAL